MNILLNKPKTTSAVIALLIVAPIGLFIYEHLATQNNHPSLVAKVQSIFVPPPSIAQAQNNKLTAQRESSKESIKPEDKAIIQKISIKAASREVDAMEETTLEEQTTYHTIQKASVPAPLEGISEEPLSDGNNIDGEVNLPNLTFTGDITEELLFSIVKEGKAMIIASTENADYEYALVGDSLSKGRFVSIQSTYMLSDRFVELPPKWQQWFQPRYNPVARDTSPMYIRLRFTRAFNQALAQEQIQAQKMSKQTVKTTVFAIDVVNNESRFTMAKTR